MQLADIAEIDLNQMGNYRNGSYPFFKIIIIFLKKVKKSLTRKKICCIFVVSNKLNNKQKIKSLWHVTF